ncbi:MAG: HAMP domain-containing sensor histidine kinase [Coriobacteriia bacterium]|nr:HAMP domain-containing sensor histidine kinase [Coriobacteriia bacterium]
MLLAYAMIVLFVVSFVPVPFYWDTYRRRREPRYLYLLMLGWLVYAAAPPFFYLSRTIDPRFAVGFAASELIGSTLFIVGALSYFVPIDARRAAGLIAIGGAVLVIADLTIPWMLSATIGIHAAVLVAAQSFAIYRHRTFRAVGGSSFAWLVVSFFVGLFAAVWWMFNLGSNDPTPFLGTTAATVLIGYFFVQFEHAAVLTALHDRETELSVHHADLERLVDERTDQLVEANERLEQVNAELAATNTRLDRALQARSDLLSRTSHELRTPLNSVIGFSGTMLQGLAGPLNVEQTKQLGMIRRAGEHLLALVNDVLDLSTADTGHHTFDFEEYHAGAIVESLVESLRPTAAELGLGLRCVVHGDALVRTDRRALDQILLNLLDNALKYTPSGTVTIEAGPCAEGVRFAVVDTGPGIPPDDVERIFEPFVRVGGPNQDAVGTGLGLSVVRSLSDALGGQVTVRAGDAGGSVFEIVLPADPASSSEVRR